MDPDDALATVRHAARKILDDNDPDDCAADADELAEAFTALDGWISAGGFLPQAWRSAGLNQLR